jgi:outer membrane protein W
MKYLVKLFVVVIAFTMITDELLAQNFGLRGGLNLADMLLKVEDVSYDAKMVPGFHIGVTAEFPISKILSFETGLLLSTKGSKISEKDVNYEFEEKDNLLYLDIPLTGKARFDVGGVNIYSVFGPYVGMGLSGKYKVKEKESGVTVTYEDDIEWGSDGDYKRLDFGLTLGAGVEISSIQIGLTYNLGLANISPYTEGGTKVQNRVLGISVGYKFGGK